MGFVICWYRAVSINCIIMMRAFAHLFMPWAMSRLPPLPVLPFIYIVHPGYVFTGFNGMNTSKISGQREVDESARGVIEAIDSIGMDNTGSFLHGNYGEGVKPLPW